MKILYEYIVGSYIVYDKVRRYYGEKRMRYISYSMFIDGCYKLYRDREEYKDGEYHLIDGWLVVRYNKEEGGFYWY